MSGGNASGNCATRPTAVANLLVDRESTYAKGRPNAAISKAEIVAVNAEIRRAEKSPGAPMPVPLPPRTRRTRNAPNGNARYNARRPPSSRNVRLDDLVVK